MRKYILLFLILFFIANISGQLQGATLTWDGGGADSNASTAANWSGDKVPENGDHIIFDGTSSDYCTWDLTVFLSSMTRASGYGGEITKKIESTLSIAKVVTWTGLGGDSYALNPLNWSTGAVPADGDKVIFNETHSGNITWDINITPSLFSMSSGYTGTITFNGDVTVNGNLTVSGGALNLNDNNIDVNGNIFIGFEGTLYGTSSTITVEGDWNNKGIFSPGSSTVVLDGTGQTIYGSTVFYNLTKNVTVADSLFFNEGTVQTITGTLALNGIADELLALRSKVPGSFWYIYPQGSLNLSYLDIQDSFNMDTADIYAADSTDAGNNISWVFDIPVPDAPFGLIATALSHDQVNLSWVDVSDNETDFYIERKETSGGTFIQRASVSADVTQYLDSGLNPETVYYYRVRAFNQKYSEYSNVASEMTWSNDIDGDGIPNNLDADDDNDGLTDYEESVLGTDPGLKDSDGDGVDDIDDAFPWDIEESSDSDGQETRITSDPLIQRRPKISGPNIVWCDMRSGGYLYTYNIDTGGQEQYVDSVMENEFYYNISGNRIVWQDNRSGEYDIYMYDTASTDWGPAISYVDSDTKPAISGNRIIGAVGSTKHDILMLDLLTGVESTIATGLTLQAPDISGDIIVSRALIGGDYYPYAYDIAKGTITQLSPYPVLQSSVSGNKVVLVDERNGRNIYVYDMSTKEESWVTMNRAVLSPSISGNRIVWSEDRNGNSDIYMYNMITEEETRITTSGEAYSPSISGNRIVWHDKRIANNMDVYLFAGDGKGDNIDICPTVYDPDQTDSDLDGIGDACDPCPLDRDTLCDVDTDSDTMMDSFELKYGLNINIDDSGDDKDGDGLSNLDEALLNTNPADYDSDNDRMYDGWEVANGLDPLLKSDGLADTDGDGIPNLYEFIYGLDPNNPDDALEDTDSDGLNYFGEYLAGTDPSNSDTDNDSIPDEWEVANDLDPLNKNNKSEDADNDGFTNLEEYISGSDPQNADSTPENRFLLKEDFEGGNMDRWTIVDEGTQNAPSSWDASNGILVQNSDISGTFAYKGDMNWKNYIVTLLMKSDDDDAIGIMFRYLDRDNYYRFSMDKESSYMRVIKKTDSAGVVTLAEDTSFSYNQGAWYKVKIFVRESSIKIYLAEYDGSMKFDTGDLVFDITDSNTPINNGKIALYSWANTGAYFDNVSVISYWTIYTVDNNGSVGQYNSLALDASGNPHISYYDQTNEDLKYAKKTGASWDIQPPVDETGSVGLYSSIAIDSSGNPHISYNDTTNNNLQYAKWTGSLWDIKTVDRSLSSTSIALDLADNPHISYRYASNMINYAKLIGSSWVIKPVGGGTSVNHYTSIALDLSGDPHISYYEYSAGLRYAKWTGSSWDIKTVDSVGSASTIPIAVDTSGGRHISYYDSLNNNLKYARRTGSSWLVTTVDNSNNVGRYPSMALDTSGNPHIVYCDIANATFKYARWTGSVWATETVGSNTASAYNSIAVDSSGIPHISYWDSSKTSLKYAIGSCPDNPDPFCGRDTDSDAILNDGDYSGFPGDNPCTGGNTENCDDNCMDASNPDQIDADSDGVGDMCDPCLNYPGTECLSSPDTLGTLAVPLDQIDLSWTDNTGNEDGFHIERKDGDSGNFVLINTVAADVSFYSDSGLEQGITYYYRVQAFNATDQSSYSNEASALVAFVSPDAVTTPASNITGSAASLNATVNPLGSDTTVYFQWGTDVSYGSQTSSQSIGSGADNVDITESMSFTPGTTYHYRIVAGNANGISYGSDIIFTTEAGSSATWNGSLSTDWDVGDNWDSGTVPDTDSDVVIPSVGNAPVLGQATVVKSLTIAQGGSLTLNVHSLTVSGNITISGVLYGGSSTISIGGSWINAGNFSRGSSTVILNGSDQNIYGDNTFYNLFKNITSADTLSFQAGSTQTVTNNLMLKGAAGQLLSLRSTSSGAYWYVDPQGIRDISFVDVMDSYNVSFTNIVVMETEAVNSLNNVNWQFGGSECVCRNDRFILAGIFCAEGRGSC